MYELYMQFYLGANVGLRKYLIARCYFCLIVVYRSSSSLFLVLFFSWFLAYFIIMIFMNCGHCLYQAILHITSHTHTQILHFNYRWTVTFWICTNFLRIRRNIQILCFKLYTIVQFQSKIEMHWLMLSSGHIIFSHT